ncbi:hypothetical protein BFW38_03405 [Terasakiispira papahanaumokuakeensis]|uniref:Uncharacterized protein n=1 Tax=Terasakiispira papahanaumokuakeensis TaxID=197479 RepID=A0A1E2V745_9GAMM|nr:hypothetical protein [Terasakiispira papahanaumokuakeensis]ODC02733.1 hypothetical protein BFW38_03405 [Terasakiispira papahanaumokuakeensis]
MARPHVTPPEPIDLTDQRIQIGDTTAFVTKFNTTQDAFERFSEATGPYAEQLNALGEYLEQRADSAEEAALSTADDRQATRAHLKTVTELKDEVVDQRTLAEDATSTVLSRLDDALEATDYANAQSARAEQAATTAQQAASDASTAAENSNQQRALAEAAAEQAAQSAIEAGPTHLSVSRNATAVTIESSTGQNAVLPAASETTAGLMTAADKQSLNQLHQHQLMFDAALFGV